MISDAEIVRAVVAGDRDAFAVLVSRHERGAWTTAWRVLRDYHAACDAAQEAFLQAYRRLGSLREPARFGVWLLRIADREAVRMARRRAMSPARPLAEDDGLTPPAAADAPLDDGDADVLDAVARLPDPERLVVALFYLEGRPVAEVAAVLGRPVGTVTKQLSRAVRRLRDRLDVRASGAGLGPP